MGRLPEVTNNTLPWKAYMSLKSRWQGLSVENRRAARGIALVAFYVMLAKAVGAAKEMVVAYHYGVSPLLDGYVFVANIVFWLTSVYYGTVSYVLVPLVVHTHTTRAPSDAEALHFREELLGNTLLLSLLLSVIGIPFLVYLVSGGWAGLEGPARAGAIYSIYWLFGLLSLPLLSSLFSSYLMAGERHANSFLEALPAGGILVLCLLLPTDHVAPLVWGTVIGLLLQTVSLSILECRGNAELRLRVGFRSSYWSRFLKGVSLLGVAYVINASTVLVDTWLAASLQAGSLSALGYAVRLVSLILSLVGTALGRGILPVLSSVYAARGSLAVRQMARRWLLVLQLFALGIVIALWLLSPYLVQILFQRGAFTPEDTLLVSNLFRVLSLQIPFYLLSMVVTNWVLAMGRPGPELVIAAIVGVVIKIAFSIVVLPSMGIFALAASSVLMIAAQALYLYWCLRR